MLPVIAPPLSLRAAAILAGPVLALEGATPHWASITANPLGHSSPLGARGAGSPGGSQRTGPRGRLITTRETRRNRNRHSSPLGARGAGSPGGSQRTGPRGRLITTRETRRNRNRNHLPCTERSEGRTGKPTRSPSGAAQRRRRPGPCARGPEQAPTSNRCGASASDGQLPRRL